MFRNLKNPRIAILPALLLILAVGVFFWGPSDDGAPCESAPCGPHQRRWRRVPNPERDACPATRAVHEALKIDLGLVVVDIGAGCGYWTDRIADSFGEDGLVVASNDELEFYEYIDESFSGDNVVSLQATPLRPTPELKLTSVDRWLFFNSKVFEDLFVALDEDSSGTPSGSISPVDQAEARSERMRIRGPISFLLTHGLSYHTRATEYFRALWRRTNDGGRVVYYLDHAPPMCLPAKELRRSLEEAGFTVVSEQDPAGFGSRKSAGRPPTQRCETFLVAKRD